MKVDFLWKVSCFLSPSFLGFLQQRLAAGPSTGHQLVSQQSMMRPISRRLKIPKSLSPASEEEPALRAWRDGKIAMISSLLCFALAAAVLAAGCRCCWLCWESRAHGPPARTTAASHLEPVYRLPPIHQRVIQRERALLSTD